MKRSRTVYHCSDHKDDLLSVFHIDITCDNPSVHPHHFCESCSVLRRAKLAVKNETIYIHNVNVHEWAEHESKECTICTHSVRGRPKKEKKNRGRPSTSSTHAAINNIIKCSPRSFLPCNSDNISLYTVPQSSGLCCEDVACSICTLLLDQPVQLSCGPVVCQHCICRLLHQHINLKWHYSLICFGLGGLNHMSK